MNELELSVVIPMYNGREYIKETVNSILPIKVNKEILIIDDGSTDDSYNFCKEIYKNNKDVKVLTKSNGGIVDTRNFGLKYAKGTYILFSDHDDIVNADTITKAIRLAKKNNFDIILWSTERLKEDNTTTPCDTVFNNEVYIGNEIIKYLVVDMLTNIENKKISYIGHLWAGLYKKNIINSNHIQFKRFVDIEDDYLFVFDYLIHCNSAALIKEVGYYWRYNLKSETYKLKYIDDIFIKYDNFYNYVLNHLEDFNISKEKLLIYEKYRKQDILIKAIENGCIVINKNCLELKKIRLFYIRNKSFFKKDSIYPYDKRRKRIYFFLRKNLLIVAQLYVYCDSIYRYLILRRGLK